MKKLLTLSAIAALALAGCAATNGGSVAAGPAKMSGVSYCVAENLERAGDSLTCNWSHSSRQACQMSRAKVTIPASSVAQGPTAGGLCSSGERLVYVTMK